MNPEIDPSHLTPEGKAKPHWSDEQQFASSQPFKTLAQTAFEIHYSKIPNNVRVKWEDLMEVDRQEWRDFCAAYNSAVATALMEQISVTAEDCKGASELVEEETDDNKAYQFAAEHLTQTIRSRLALQSGRPEDKHEWETVTRKQAESLGWSKRGCQWFDHYSGEWRWIEPEAKDPEFVWGLRYRRKRPSSAQTGSPPAGMDKKAQASQDDGFRICEFCGCNTNAKMRACCEKGRQADSLGSPKDISATSTEESGTPKFDPNLQPPDGALELADKLFALMEHAGIQDWKLGCVASRDLLEKKESKLQSAHQQIAELTEWKRRILEVCSHIDDQKIATMLGCPSGESTFKWINDRVPEVLSELDAAQKRIGELSEKLEAIRNILAS